MRRSAAQLHHRVVEPRELPRCLLDNHRSRLLPVCGKLPRHGRECLIRPWGPARLVFVRSFPEAEATGEQPQEVSKAAGHDAGLALGPEEDDGLVFQGPVGVDARI